MASTTLFIVMVVLVCILLLTSDVAAAVAASDVYSSSFYNTNSSLQSAHQYLTISAALGWTVLGVLIIMVIVAAVAGGFNKYDVHPDLESRDAFTPDEKDLANKVNKILGDHRTTQIIVLVVLVIMTLVTIIVGILSAIAASNISSSSQQDNRTKGAYTNAVVSAVSCLGGLGIMIVVLVTYIGIRSHHNKTVKALTEVQEKPTLIPMTEIKQPYVERQVRVPVEQFLPEKQMTPSRQDNNVNIEHQEYLEYLDFKKRQVVNSEPSPHNVYPIKDPNAYIPRETKTEAINAIHRGSIDPLQNMQLPRTATN